MSENIERFKQFVADAEFAAYAFGNEQMRDFTLIAAGMTPQLPADWEKRGMQFVGVLGVVRGEHKARFAVPVTEDTVRTLHKMFESYADIEQARMSARHEERPN